MDTFKNPTFCRSEEFFRPQNQIHVLIGCTAYASILSWQACDHPIFLMVILIMNGIDKKKKIRK